MRELKLTGWMSNRGRQNVASFLTKDLGLDWRLGAEWFESQLVSGVWGGVSSFRSIASVISHSYPIPHN